MTGCEMLSISAGLFADWDQGDIFAFEKEYQWTSLL